MILRRYLLGLTLALTSLGFTQAQTPTPQVKFTTSAGEFVIELYPDKAPNTVVVNAATCAVVKPASCVAVKPPTCVVLSAAMLAVVKDATSATSSAPTCAVVNAPSVVVFKVET